MKKNDGKKYEKLVRDIQQVLIDIDNRGHDNVQVELNKKIDDRFGITREFDIYWSFSMGGVEYKTVIECKDYENPVSIDKIDALIGKAADIPGLRLIFASKKGYQSGAKEKAKSNNIKLIIVREGNDSDWISAGFSKEVQIESYQMNLPIIKSFSPVIDCDWYEAQDGVDISVLLETVSSTSLDDLYLIHSIENEKLSVASIISEFRKKSFKLPFGEKTHVEKLTNSFLIVNSTEIKISEYEIIYECVKPMHSQFNMDFSDDLLGVIEISPESPPKLIFKDGSTS